jgi:hypothetical protein
MEMNSELSSPLLPRRRPPARPLSEFQQLSCPSRRLALLFILKFVEQQELAAAIWATGPLYRLQSQVSTFYMIGQLDIPAEQLSLTY